MQAGSARVRAAAYAPPYDGGAHDCVASRVCPAAGQPATAWRIAMALPLRRSTRRSNSARLAPDAGFSRPGRPKPAPRLEARQALGQRVPPEPARLRRPGSAGGPHPRLRRKPFGHASLSALTTAGPPAPFGRPPLPGGYRPPNVGAAAWAACLSRRAHVVCSNAFATGCACSSGPAVGSPLGASPAWARAIGLLNVARPFGRGSSSSVKRSFRPSRCMGTKPYPSLPGLLRRRSATDRAEVEALRCGLVKALRVGLRSAGAGERKGKIDEPNALAGNPARL